MSDAPHARNPFLTLYEKFLAMLVDVRCKFTLDESRMRH